MEIVIYWDSLFLINFIMNYWILRVLKHKFSLCVNSFRLVLAAFLGAGIYLFCFLIAGTRFIQFLEICISIPMMVLVVLPRRDRQLFPKALLSGLFCSFFVAGILRTLFAKGCLLFGQQIHIGSVIVSGYIVIVGIRNYVYTQKEKKERRLFDVTLKSEKGEICLTALLDTGNSLIEPISKKPVCLLECGILAKLIEKEKALYSAIPYRSVGCEKGILYATKIPEMQIAYDGKEILLKEVFCAEATHKLSTNDTYNMILHPACIREL